MSYVSIIKYLVQAVFLFAVAFCNFACSKPCNLAPASAPELRGFRLGMTLDEVKQKFPNLPPIAANEYGLSKIYFERTPKIEQSFREFNFIDATSYEPFAGTRRVYLEIIDNKVAAVKVVYTNDISWKSEDEFIQRTAESLNIPGTWSGNNGYSSLQCQESLFFSAGIGRDLSHTPSATNEKYPYIEMYNVRSQMQPELKRMKKDEEANKQKEAQKETFKP